MCRLRLHVSPFCWLSLQERSFERRAPGPASRGTAQVHGRRRAVHEHRPAGPGGDKGSLFAGRRGHHKVCTAEYTQAHE